MIIPVLAILAAQAHDPDIEVRDYPLQPSFDYAESNRVTALCLVDCLAPGRAGTRRYEYPEPVAGFDPGDTEGSERGTWTETVRVIDSPALPQGATVRVVVAGVSHLTPTYHMRPGGRYLLLASLSKSKRLETPHSGPFATGTDTARAIPGEVSGFAAFPTRASVLYRSPLTTDRIANSVVDCIPGSDAPGIQRIANWLSNSRYPNAGDYQSAFGREPFPLSERIKSLALKQSAYHRYKLFQALCQWCVFGSEQKWVDAIIDLASETSALLPGDTTTGGELSFSQIRAGRDPKYVVVSLDANRWADIIITAKNDTSRVLLLDYVARLPDRAHLDKLAQTLLGTDKESLLRAAVRYFSLNLKRPDLEPKYLRGIDGGGWINREESLASLRTIYGLKLPAGKG